MPNSVQQEAEKIRLLLEQYLPGLGGGTVDEETLVALLAALTTNIGIRQPAQTGYWVYIPTDEGDFNTGLLVGNESSNAIAAEFASNDTAINAMSGSGNAIIATSQTGIGVFGRSNSEQPGIRAQNNTDGVAFLSTMSGYDYSARIENDGPGPGLYVKSGAEDAGIAVQAAGSGVGITAAGGIGLSAVSSGGPTNQRIGVLGQSLIGVQGNGDSVGVYATSGTGAPLRVERTTEVAGESGIEIRVGGTWRAVKIGAAGTGPGGSGRALYID